MDVSATYELFLPYLTPPGREKLFSIAHLETFDEGEYIFREGDHALNLYIVKSGEVAIEAHIPPRGTVTLMTVEQGEWFSWSALLEPRIETASGRAVSACEVLAIRGGALTDICHEDPDFGFEIYRALAEVISQRLLQTRLQLLDMYGND